jgi:hypothetical protein
MKILHTLIAIVTLASAGKGHAYDVATHALISNSAYTQSRLGSTADLVFSLGLASWVLPNAPLAPFETINGSDTYLDMSGSTASVRTANSYEDKVLKKISPTRGSPGRDSTRLNGWLMRGAIREDDTGGPLLLLLGGAGDDPIQNVNRFCNHFLDPTRPNGTPRGFSDTPLCPFPDPIRDAAQWAIGSDSPFDPSPQPLQGRRNHFTVLDAREAMWRALTLLDASGNPVSLTVSGATLSAEDMRRAYWATTFRALGDVIHTVQDMGQPQHTRNEGHPLPAYEAYIDARATGAGSYFIDGQNLTARSGQLDDLKYDGYTIPRFNRYSDYWSTQVNTPGQYWGLADYSNRGFFTLKNNIGDAKYTQPDPQCSQCTPQTMDSGYFGLSARYIMGSVPDGIPGVPSATNVSVSTYSVFTDQPGSHYTLSAKNYDDRVALLVPRAAAYSAGLIDYFFRGKLLITPPNEGVYAFVDHSRFSGSGADGSPTDLNGFKGFNKIRVKIQNITDPAHTPNGDQGQNIGTGNFIAIAKFHRNMCYTDDLSGELAGSSVNVASCRPQTQDVEEIVLSDQKPADSAVNTGGKEYEFLFSKEIPINAMDLYIQIAYRGQLGAEADAVAVGTVDVSEPTYLAITNSQDYIWISGDGPFGGSVYTEGDIFGSPDLTAKLTNRSCVDGNQKYIMGCLTANTTTTMGLTLQVFNGGSAVGATSFQKTNLDVLKFIRIAFLTDANRTDYTDTLQYNTMKGCQLGGSPTLVPLQQERAVVSTDGGNTWIPSDRFRTMQTARGVNSWVQLDCVISGDNTWPSAGLIPNMTIKFSDLHPLAIDSTPWDNPLN